MPVQTVSTLPSTMGTSMGRLAADAAEHQASAIVPAVKLLIA